MGFASDYLQKRALFPELILEAPAEDTDIIVVIPSFNEPGIIRLLDSLILCHEPDCRTEVIIIVNAPSGASAESLINNRRTIIETGKWEKEHSGCFFKLYVIDIISGEYDDWGVGMARKSGMDEAVRRFNLLNKPDGIILNLDADCTVRPDYFTSVYCEMVNNKNLTGCSIYFEHPVSGNEFSEDVYRAIILYELHLRYYFQALAFSGFPYVHHTVGSAIAVKALPYVKAGGMNRRMAGEDFYFIQKLVPAGGFINLYTTTVYPSPRLSSRVPFGTGPAVARITESDNGILLTYNFQSFMDLRRLFSLIDRIFVCSNDDPEFAYSDLPQGLKQSIDINVWAGKIIEIKKNTSGIQSFRKRFFGWFNMFRIVKYLNAVHISVMEKQPVDKCALELLNALGKDFKSKDTAELLAFYRLLELKS
jgi:hypothetical protein